MTRFAGNPYLFLGDRPRVEAEIRSYLVREHRRGRPLAEILDDAHLARYADSLCWRVLTQPETIDALARDVEAALTGCYPNAS